MSTSRREFLGTAAGLLLAGAAGAGRAAGQTPRFEGSRAGEARAIGEVAFRWCPPGRFRMGSPPDEPERRPDEGPVEVTVTRGFWTSRDEVTQGQWRRLAGDFPDRPPTPEFGMGDDFPMYWVSHDEAGRFCATLTERGRRAGDLPAGWEVRLPTEAQWEYACRAGTTTAFAFGDRLDRARANVTTDPPPGARFGTGIFRATPVGSYPANAWGLRDMHGNLFEWCRDWYHARLPGGVDPDLSGVPGVRNGDGSYSRVRRGGAWNDAPRYCRSAMRLRYEPHRRSDHIGFRVVAIRV